MGGSSARSGREAVKPKLTAKKIANTPVGRLECMLIAGQCGEWKNGRIEVSHFNLFHDLKKNKTIIPTINALKRIQTNKTGLKEAKTTLKNA